MTEPESDREESGRGWGPWSKFVSVREGTVLGTFSTFLERGTGWNSRFFSLSFWRGVKGGLPQLRVRIQM